MAKLKAEFLQHYYDANGVPFRSKLIARFSQLSRLGLLLPSVYNFIVTNPFTAGLLKKSVGFATNRSLPTLAPQTLHKWFTTRKKPSISTHKKVYLFCDEFTNYNDVNIGKKAVALLENLGYEVMIPQHVESGRTWLSKGLVKKAAEIINRNIEFLSPIISAEIPLLGIEPSAIITFRDEYVDLATEKNLPAAKELAKYSFLLDEFLAAEFKAGKISADQFTQEGKEIQLHGHCQQKALSKLSDTVTMLSIPANFAVSVIPSGCCGMAGSFGYEKEHFEVSNKIGELVLFPAVRNKKPAAVTVAPGTSCRHQIKDGTGVISYHPVEILFQALKTQA
jgi:Fe-S oxidoreductase